MPGPPDIDRYDSRRSVVYAPSGVVATSQPLAAAAGTNALKEGGNAFDAAVTAAAALNVVEPFMTGIGGDVFALYRTPADGVGALRSMGTGPVDASIPALREALDDGANGDGDGIRELPDRGPLTVTPPGAARGWERLVADFGRRDLADALDPAIRYAREGFPVTEVIASQWADAAGKLDNDHAREAFLLDERAPTAGEEMRNEALAGTFERVAADGADILYEGELAERIIETVRSRGGFLSADDLRGVEAEYVEPISVDYGDATVYELPAPNQGPIAIEALAIAERVGARDAPEGSVDETHRYVEAFKRAFQDGHHYVADPDFEAPPGVTEESWVEARAESVGPEAATDLSPHGLGGPAEDADTVLVTVADEAGNVVSLINSVFTAFGSGLAAEGTGVVLQSRGASFSLDPEQPNSFEPGKRPFHTLIPGAVRFGDDDWAAFGVMGGYMQPQGHLQVLARLIDRDDTLQAALDRPRWCYKADGTLAVESRMDDRLVTKLARRGHEIVVEPPDEFGGGQFARNDCGVLSGATEPRKDGTVVGF